MNCVIRIVYNNYLDEEGNITLGGVENYITNLIEMCKEVNLNVVIYQFGNKPQEYRINETTTVILVEQATTAKHLLKYIEKHNHDYDKDILIFASDFMTVPNKFKKSISIQHGIAWDITTDEMVCDFKNYILILRNALGTIKKYNRYKNCTDLVCVDNNFINWYRTQVMHVNGNIHNIPNFTKIREFLPRNNTKKLSVIFARRLVDYRGTKLFSKAIKEVIKLHPEISVTIAGTGPDEEWMKTYLKECLNVTFTVFKSEDSIEFHSNYDIAVVPTKGSEGTSLSLLEAMSAGCAVIATNVGGMTNIIINDYNGLLISPDVNELASAITYMIENVNERRRMAQKGHETVERGFSLEVWKEKWKEVLFSYKNVGDKK